MSFSRVDPCFAALYARREEERLAERLAARRREPALCEPDPTPAGRREPRPAEGDAASRGGHLRLL